MKRKWTSLATTFLMVVTLLTGCGGNNTDVQTDKNPNQKEATQKTGSSAKPFDGVTLSVICAETPYLNTIREKLPEFEQDTGITVEIDQYENNQLSTQVAVNASAGGSELDVILYRPIQENLAYISKGWLENLDTYIEESGEDYDYNDYTESARAITGAYGSAYGIPLVTEREIVQFNKDMLKEVGYENIPGTYDGLVELCEKLKQAGYTPLGLRGEGNAAVTQFSGFLYGFGGDFIDQSTHKATINTPEFKKALKFYGSLCSKYAPVGVVNAGWEQTSNWFTQEQVAMRIDCDSQFSYALNEDNSLVYDKVGYGVLPGETEERRSPFSIVAWAIGISSGSEQKDASWEFIKWATSKNIDLLAQQQGNFSARNSTWANSEASKNIPNDLITVIEESNQIAVPFDRPYIQAAGEARTAIGELITAAEEGVDDAVLDAKCEQVNSKVQELLDEEYSA